MKLFTRHQEVTIDAESRSFWPADGLDEVDDAEFAKAIAAGRLAEQLEDARELVGA
jgi:hypothetical protein